MTTIRHGGPCGLQIEMKSAERDGKSVLFHAPGVRWYHAPGLEGGGWGTIPAQDMAKPLPSICLIPLWLSTLNRPVRAERGEKAVPRATPVPVDTCTDPASTDSKPLSV